MRLVDAEVVKQLFDSGACISTDTNEDKVYVRELIDAIPTIDAKPVKHGYWTRPYNNAYRRCSVCGIVHYGIPWDAVYCPFCGAKNEVKK